MLIIINYISHYNESMLNKLLLFLSKKYFSENQYCYYFFLNIFYLINFRI